jgi:hypothetical protein
MRAHYHFKSTDLVVRGVIVDKIDGFTGRRHWDDDFNKLADFLDSDCDSNPYGDDAALTEAIWRTLVGNRDYGGERAPAKYACILDIGILDSSCLSFESDGSGNIISVQHNLHLWWTRNAKIRINGKPLESHLKSLGILREDSKTYNEAAGRVDRFLWSRRLVTTMSGRLANR